MSPRDSDLAEKLQALAAEEPRLAPLVQIVVERVLGAKPPPVRRFGTAELMERLGVKHPSTIYRWVQEGRCPPPEYLGGKLKVWREDVVLAWEAQRLATPHVKVRRGIAARKGRATP